MRSSFINRLATLAKEDKKITMVVGDLGYGVLKSFYEDLPNQFINAGISEQNMMSMCASLGLCDKKVYAYSIGNFPSLRCLEQIRNDILYHDSNVKIISVGSGFGYGQLGMSHHATEDFGIMRCLPNIIIFTPSDPLEAEQIADLTLTTNKPAYIRLGKGKEPIIHDHNFKVEIGKSLEIIKGTRVALFVAGPGSDEAYNAANELNSRGISTALYSFPTIKPIDKKRILKCFKDFELIITVEEHNIVGGFASIISEVAMEQKNKAILKKVGLNDEYVSIVGTQKYIREKYNITKNQIIKIVTKELEV